LVVYPKTIEMAVMSELPFMATEEILMAAVQKGGDRQELHEVIRRHSQAAAESVKMHGKSNDLITRLRADEAFAGIDLDAVMDPSQFVGRAPEQVDDFIREVVVPIRQRYRALLGQSVELKV
jgi:adenylosuccinate lyase